MSPFSVTTMCLDMKEYPTNPKQQVRRNYYQLNQLFKLLTSENIEEKVLFRVTYLNLKKCVSPGNACCRRHTQLVVSRICIVTHMCGVWCDKEDKKSHIFRMWEDSSAVYAASRITLSSWFSISRAAALNNI